MTSGVILLIVILFTLALAITLAEIWDSREDKRHRRLLDEDVRCTGTVKGIEKHGALEVRTPYPWRVLVEFEYAGIMYSVTSKCMSKPQCGVGDKVTVLIDKSDPDASIVIIE